MPLNKLENFIKNTEGRILYVNPNDLDATDGIENQGNSLTKPFKTIQRALIESARFSYLEGNDNDITEKTTILLFPGEHLVDNRPGFGIKSVAGDARAVTPSGAVSNIGATETFTLTLNSNFDLTQEDNILYKFNSVHGGVVVPRGTSIVGLDLRKTKIRPKYVPNPTDDDVPNSAIFRITGSCYFWQFTIFDGDETTLVYTDNQDFGSANQSKPTFSHHKLTVFEYADGVNNIESYQLTDLQVYYSKLSNAFNRASTREITQKFPVNPEGFAPQRPEFEIVGAFATDDKAISRIIAGDGATAGNLVTVTTSLPHEVSAGTPIKINGVNVTDFNISTKVQNVIDENRFTYLLPFVRPNLPAGPSAGLSGSGAFVSVETDTVTGASPYIFNCSMRSVYGMCGMHADGSKATGFKSMVVAQFTGVSLQKDDRAFAEYNPTNRGYDKISYTKQTGNKLSSESSSLINETVYHLKSTAVYREGWKNIHVRVSNDAVIQIVSVFAIGYHMHFLMESGGDASVTNSNSNFGQFALGADGFKKRAFDKDNRGFATNIIAPRAVVSDNFEVEWLQVDKDSTQKIYAACVSGNNSDGTSINLNDPAVTRKNRIYLLGQTNPTLPPSDIAQGFRIGAKVNEKLEINAGAYSATIFMSKGAKQVASSTSEKKYTSVFHSDPVNNVNDSIYVIEDVGGHELMNGESIRIISESGRLPEGLDPHAVYFAITSTQDSDLATNEIRIASSRANAELADPEYLKTISDRASGDLKILSRVSDKRPGELGHPLQFDTTTYNGAWDLDNPSTLSDRVGGWFVHVDMDNTINKGLIGTSLYSTYYTGTAPAELTGEEIPYIVRTDDSRSLDEKLFKVRYVVPKEIVDAKDPTDGFILQDSSSTGVTRIEDFDRTEIGNGNDLTIQPNDPGYEFDRNLRYIAHLSYDTNSTIATVRSDKTHNLKPNDQIIIRGITTTTNTTGLFDKEFNGTFKVETVIDDKTFTYKVKKLVDGEPVGETIIVGTYTNSNHVRNTDLPRFERNDTKQNLFIYRAETITPYKYNVQDGVYHLFVLNGNNTVEKEFTSAKYNQSVVDLYPQLDRDNTDDNPQASQSYAQLFPIGQVSTNDLKKSITRETINTFVDTFGISNTINTISSSVTNPTLTLSSEHHLNGLRYVEDGDITSNTNNAAPHVSGTYHNIKLFSSSVSPSSAPWKGATAKVVVDDTTKLVTSAEIIEGGSGYSAGDELYFDASSVANGGIGGAPTNSKITVKADHISIVNDVNYLQVTGITTGTDAYYRIQSTPDENQVNIRTHVDNPTILPGQQILDLGPYSEVTGFDPTTDSETVDDVTTTTFTTSTPHGLSAGNRIRFLNKDDKNLVDIVVSEVKTDATGNPTIFTSITTGITLTSTAANDATTPKYLLKHGLGSHDAISGRAGENLGTRGVPFFDHDTLQLGSIIATEGQFLVNFGDGTVINSGTAAQKLSKRRSVESRFPLGSYIQVDNEIMRVRKKSLDGTNFDNLVVIRGALGTNIAPHDAKSVIRKIKPLPLEVRRPSILRASGHTFEYLGYGPGNYSTALPQITKRTLTEREEFLSQSQETSCGTVVYTGMNDKGDFYIGNTKISADSGEQVTFDIPIPTVTGEDPSKLSVIFDEVIVKERILVEGGASNQILSQFNGPVTFNGTVRFSKDLTVTQKLKVLGVVNFQNEKDNTSTNCASGSLDAALNVTGGVAIGKNLYVCKEIKTFSSEQAVSTSSGALVVSGGIGVAKNAYIGGLASITGNTTIGGTLEVTNDTTLKGNVILGDDINADEVSFNSKVNTDLLPSTNGSKTLGNSGNKWGNLFASAATLDSATITNNTASNSKTSGALIVTGGVGIGGDLNVGGDITAFSASDSTLKQNVVVIPNALDKVKAISGNTFDWIELRSNKSGPDTGVIAQEIQALGLPGVTTVRDHGIIAVDYQKLVPLLIEAIKELSTKVDALS